MMASADAKIPSKDVAAVKKCEESYNKIKDELSKVIVGQDEVIEQVLISMFARGHAPSREFPVWRRPSLSVRSRSP